MVSWFLWLLVYRLDTFCGQISSNNSQPFKFYEVFVIQFFQISILNFADFMENDKIKKYISSLIFSADSWNSLKFGMVSQLISI